MRLIAGAMVALMAYAPALAAPKAPVALAPASDWSLRETGESCRLTRTFGDGTSKVLLRLDRFEPTESFTVLIAGEPLARIDRPRARIEFGPGGMRSSDGNQGGSVGSYKPGLYSSGWSLGERSASPATITWVEVASKGRPPVRLDLGPMDKPIAMLTKCSDGLLGKWGLDADAHRKLTRLARPIGNPGTWLISNDYPLEMLRKGSQGTVNFRLSIDPAGKVTACHVQQVTNPPGFGETVCSALMRKAAFEPALGPDGTPHASYFVTSARFEIPG